jgi:autotransporter family porin
VSNTSKGVGGALAVFGNLSLADSSLTLSRVDNPGLAVDFEPIGGGAFVQGGAAITDTQFFSNTAIVTGTLGTLAQGGGLAVVGNLTLSGGDLRNNSARQGGGLYVQGNASVQHSLFQTNRAGEGGGLFADGDLVLLSNRLLDNTALLADATNQPGRGGGVFLQNASFGNQISNNLFLGNQALSVNARANS